MTKNVSVALQSATITRGSAGSEVETWATYATVWGSVKSLRGDNYYAAQQQINEVTMELYIWYRSDVLAKHRAIINGVTYEISAPPENLNMQNKELLLRLRYVS